MYIGGSFGVRLGANTSPPLKVTTLPSKGYHQALLHHLALLLAREEELLHQQAVKHPKICPSAMPPFGPLWFPCVQSGYLQVWGVCV